MFLASTNSQLRREVALRDREASLLEREATMARQSLDHLLREAILQVREDVNRDVTELQPHTSGEWAAVARYTQETERHAEALIAAIRADLTPPRPPPRLRFELSRPPAADYPHVLREAALQSHEDADGRVGSVSELQRRTSGESSAFQHHTRGTDRYGEAPIAAAHAGLTLHSPPPPRVFDRARMPPELPSPRPLAAEHRGYEYDSDSSSGGLTANSSAELEDDPDEWGGSPPPSILLYDCLLITSPQTTIVLKHAEVNFSHLYDILY